MSICHREPAWTCSVRRRIAANSVRSVIVCHLVPKVAAFFMTALWVFCGMAVCQRSAFSEEICLYDNTRIYGLITEYKAPEKLRVLLPTGEQKEISLAEIVSIRFKGRSPVLIQTGTQEFRTITGDKLRAEIQGYRGSLLQLQSHLAGMNSIDLNSFRGFVSLPIEGFAGRKATTLVENSTPLRSAHLDWVLDRRGSTYPGVLRRFEQTKIELDHEDLGRTVPFKMHYVAGVRLADAARTQTPQSLSGVGIRVYGRDGSRLTGELVNIHMGVWTLKPQWGPRYLLQIDFNEIELVQTINGRVQYLSQLDPVKVHEKTILAPPQPYGIDKSCQGDALAIGTKAFSWGLGVHAHSELTYSIGKRFSFFRATIGVAARMRGRGSVVFHLMGDGKELYRSPVIHGEQIPEEIDVSVKGVETLMLKVTDGGDLDLGDVANWGSARLVR